MSTSEPFLGRLDAARRVGVVRGTGRLGPVSRLGIAAAAGAAWGAATEWSVPHLPTVLSPLANSAGPWIVVSLAMALMTVRLRESVTLAVLCLLALVAGFYVVEDIRGWGLPAQQITLWAVASLVFGPLVGLAANWLRSSGDLRAAVGAGALGGLFAGEAVNGLMNLRFWTPATYWDVQLAVGIALVLGLPIWLARGAVRSVSDRQDVHRRPGGVVALAAALLVAGLVGLSTYAAYQIP